MKYRKSPAKSQTLPTLNHSEFQRLELPAGNSGSNLSSREICADPEVSRGHGGAAQLRPPHHHSGPAGREDGVHHWHQGPVSHFFLGFSSVGVNIFLAASVSVGGEVREEEEGLLESSMRVLWISMAEPQVHTTGWGSTSGGSRGRPSKG